MSFDEIKRIWDEILPKEGRYKVVLLDKMDLRLGSHVVLGEFSSIEEVERKYGNTKLGAYEEIVVYDSKGKIVKQYGGDRNDDA